MRLMIFGAGFSGCIIGEKLGKKCDFVGGTTRMTKRFETLRSHHISPFIFSGDGFSDELLSALKQTTHLVQSISPAMSPAMSPNTSGDPLLSLFEGQLKTIMPNLEWVGYLSTVGVYGNHDGRWVDEESICQPLSTRSITRLKTENLWAEFCRTHQTSLAILRLSGIYGPNRNTFENYKQGKARRLIKKDQVFNRIYVDDIARATKFLAIEKLSGIYNITDDMPAPPQDVVAYAAFLLGIKPPAETDFQTAELTPMARSFYSENKRVSNNKIKNAGFEFIHPDYRSALNYLYLNYYANGL